MPSFCYALFSLAFQSILQFQLFLTLLKHGMALDLASLIPFERESLAYLYKENDIDLISMFGDPKAFI